jgi:ATP-dependent DNA helicase RecG
VAQKLARKKKMPYKEYPRYRIGIPVAQHKATIQDAGDAMARASAATVDEGQIQFHRLYIGNLPPDTSNQKLFDIFSEFGDIVDLRIPRAKTIAKGFAFIEFASADSTARVLAATKAESPMYDDRKLVINIALKKTTKDKSA